MPPLFQHQLSPSEAFEILYWEEDGDREVTEHRQAVLHQPAALSCDTSAIPPPRLTWYKDGEPLAPGPGVLILLGNAPAVKASPARGGWILSLCSCQHAQRPWDPRCITGAVWWPCTAGWEGDSAWDPHHGAVPTTGLSPPCPPRAAGGRVLQLPAVREEDAGRYTCEASNEAGRDRVHYELEVLGE